MGDLRKVTRSADSGLVNDVVVRVDGISKRFVTRRNAIGLATRHIDAVKNVSFEIRPGEVYSLVGGSGSGKSTVARLITRLEKPDAGSIEVKGVDWASRRQFSLQKHRRNLQMVFQNPFASLDPTRQILDAVGEPLVIHRRLSGKALKDAVLGLLDDVGLPSGSLYKYPQEFSGGQRQRIAIARALAIDPDVIIADEAVSALDVSSQAKVLNLLLRLQQERGLAILFITHDLGVVRQVADRIGVMRFGELVEEGEAENIFERPQHEYTKQLLDSVPVMGRWD